MIRWYGNVKESKCFNNTLWNFYLLLYNIWSEYHVLFCIVFCSMLFCKVTIVTCFHQTTKCQPSEPLSIDIMPYIMNKIFTGEAFCGNPSAPASEAGGDRSSRRGLLDFPRILGSFWSLDYFDIHHTSHQTILSAMGSTRNGKYPEIVSE